MVEPVQKAMEVMEMLSQTKIEWLKYQDRLKAIRDQHSREVEAAEDREKAIEQAVAQAVAQGSDIGMRKLLVEQIHHFQRALNIALTPVIELDRLDVNDLKAMSYSLAAQSPKN